MGSTFYKTAEDTLAFGVLKAYRRYELRQARYHEMVAPIAPFLLGGGAEILDIGAGYGEAKQFVDTAGGTARWTGVEMDPRRVQACLQLGYSRIIDQIDLEKDRLPMPDASYDVVIASHILEHLQTPDAAFRDWYRVLKPGGLLLLGVPMHLIWVAWIMRLRFRLIGRKPHAHCLFFNMPSLRRFLSAYPVRRIWGFRVLSARRQLPLEDWHWFYRASLWIGRVWPGATAEVNVEIRKPK